MSATADRALAARVLEDAGAAATRLRELPDDPIQGLIAFARELVGQPGRARDLAVMLDTIDRLLERRFAEEPPRPPAHFRAWLARGRR